MKVAKEKVWVDAKGNLVADGDDSAVSLVARKGQNIPDSEVEKFKNGSKFFSDAVFDGDGKQVEHADDSGPKPKNREAEMPPRKTR